MDKTVAIIGGGIVGFTRSFSKELFCRSLQRLVPEIRMDDLAQGGAGVRAQALSPAGELLQDFYLFDTLRYISCMSFKYSIYF